MDDAHVEELLEENLELAKETAADIHKMRKQSFWLGVLRLVLWLVVLAGIPVFLYLHFLKPTAGLFGF